MTKRLEVVLGDLVAVAQHDERTQALAEVRVLDADHRGVGDRRVGDEQLLDLAREDVLAARDDHLVVAAVDEQAAGRVEVADVAGREQAVDDLLAAAAGVALERRERADEDAARLPLRQLAPLSSRILMREPEQRLADRRRRGADVVGRRHRRERDLGRAVEVVDHVAEHRRRARRHLGRQLRARAEHARAATTDRARRISSSPSASTRWSMIGTTQTPVARCSAMSSRNCAASKRRRSTSFEPRPIDSSAISSPVPWNSGGADDGRLAGAHRHPLEHRAGADEPARVRARRALRRAGRAARQQHDPPRLARAPAAASGRRRRSARRARRRPGSSIATLTLAQRRLDVGDGVRELGVVDEQSARLRARRPRRTGARRTPC